jgi:predicted urease superfamily metal-dependent hydrolase
LSEAALEPLLREKENTISATRAEASIGVHPAHMDELQKLGLLEKVEGAVLKLLKAEAYYTRQSVDILK